MVIPNRSAPLPALAALPWRWLGWGAAALLAIAVPFLVGDDRYLLSLVTVSAIWAILAVSVAMLFRSTGLLSMAHGAFFGIGAYAVGIVTAIHHGSFWVAVPVGILVSIALGIVVGFGTLRLRSHYFAITTLSLGLVVQAVITQWTGLTQGALGIPSIPAPDAIQVGGLRIGFEPGPGLYYLVAVALAAALLISRRFLRSPFGRGCVAVKDNELLASFLGLDVRVHRLGSFVLSTAIAAVAGSLYAVDVTYIEPSYSSFVQAFQALVQGQVGGIASTIGPAVGAFSLTVLPEMLSDLQDSYLLVYGVLLVIVILFFRDGLVGSLGRAVSALRLRVWPEAAAPSAAAARPAAGTAVLGPSRLAGTNGDAHALAGHVLRCEDLTIRYGGLTAVEGVSLGVAAGELLSVVGPNGAGKSSLFNGLTGATPLAAGRVEFDGADITGTLPHRLVRRGMVRTFQSAQLFDTLTTLENAMVGRLRHLEGTLAGMARTSNRPSPLEVRERERVTALLEWVGLGDELRRRASELPIGKKQRLAVAMALATEPRVLLLDEPLAGLSDDAIAGMLDLFRSVRDRGIGVVLIEHRMRAVMAVADRVVVLDRGRKIAEGSPREIGRNEQVVTAYLGARFRA